jgi:hypothetical protein
MKIRIGTLLLAAIAVCLPGWSQNGGIKVQPQDQLTKYLPATVFLDNENVPTQKRNAVLLDVKGKRAVVTLIDTSGYSAAYVAKYVGAILTVGGLKIGSSTLPSGAYGFGETKTGEGPNGSVTIHVYDIGGKEVTTIPTEHEKNMRGVRPLQVIVGTDGAAQLYLGQYHTSIAPAE